MGELWERQPGEPAKAHDHFRAYLAYLAAGGERGLAAFAEAHGISRDLAKKLSSRHDWRHRTTAYQAANVIDIDATRTDLVPVPEPVDVLPTSATAEMVDQVTEARLDLAQRRIRLAERRVTLAEQAADLAETAIEHLSRNVFTELDPELQIKIINAAARLLGDALPKELIIDSGAGRRGGDLTEHPDWAPMADTIMSALADYPDAMESLAEMLYTRATGPDIVDAEVV